jgi:hypothetical protein
MIRSLVILSLCCLVHAAAADNAAGAEAAFQRGRALLKQGKYQEACEAFERSQKLDPQIGTRYNLALCWEKIGKLASAWTAFREVAQRDTNKTRRDQAAKKATGLEPRLPKLRLTAAALPDLKITSNGEDVTDLVDLDSPMDPGSYEIVATATGYKPWSTKIEIAQPGKLVSVAVPALQKASEVKAAAPAPRREAREPRREARVEAPAPPATPAARESSRGTIGKITTGASAVVAATGLVFGVLSRSKWNAVRELCGDDFICDSDADYARGQELVDAARLRGNLATGLVGVGLAGVAIGATLWLTTPKPRERAALHVAPAGDGRSVGVVLGGAF